MAYELSLQEILDVASSLGHHLLKYGAEINRVEETVQRICYAYDVEKAHVFAIAATIVTTIEKDGVSLTRSKRVYGMTPDLDKVEKYNALSRFICTKKPSYEEIAEQEKKIKASGVYSFWMVAFAYALIGASFSVFFGGGIWELTVGFIVGLLLKFVMHIIQKFKAPPFFANAAGSAFTVSVVHLFSYVFPELNAQTSTIGVLMLLVPGVLLTNCIRDFVSTDYTAGVTKIIEAFITATAIAAGVGVSFLWR